MIKFCQRKSAGIRYLKDSWVAPSLVFQVKTSPASCSATLKSIHGDALGSMLGYDKKEKRKGRLSSRLPTIRAISNLEITTGSLKKLKTTGKERSQVESEVGQLFNCVVIVTISRSATFSIKRSFARPTAFDLGKTSIFLP